jgi:hypothetical protein
MRILFRNACRLSLVSLLVVSFLVPYTFANPVQNVTASELRDAVRKSAASREENLRQVRSFFSDPAVRNILVTARVDTNKIEQAIATMEPAELAKLAARTAQIQSDFAAGALTNQELTYVIIALGAAVLVLIVVAA